MIFKIGKAVVSESVFSYLLLAVGLFFLIVIGIDAQLPHFSENLWQDPIKHQLAVMRARSLSDLRINAGIHSQPVLEYALRKFFWFPIFGVNETTFRLPSLIYFLTLLLATPYLVRRGVRSLLPQLTTGRDLFLIFLALGFVFLQIADPLVRANAAEGRHYMFVILTSFVWCGVVFLGGYSRWTVFFASLIFANAHFFALPFIAFVYAIRLGCGIFVEKHKSTTIYELALGLSVLVITVGINFPGIYGLITNPPRANVRVVTDAMTLSFILQRYFALVGGWVLLLLPLAIFFRLRGAIVLTAAVVVVIPAELWLITTRSDYLFSERYFAAFAGLFLPVYVYVVCALWVLLRRFGAQVWQAYGLVIALVCLFLPWEYLPAGDFTFAKMLAAKESGWRTESSFARNYRQLWLNDRPYLLILNYSAFVGDIEIAEFYLRDWPVSLNEGASPVAAQFLVNRAPHYISDVDAGAFHVRQRATFQSFVDLHPDYTLILDNHFSTRPCKAEGAAKAIGAENAQCLLVFSGVRDLEALEKITRQFSFPIAWASPVAN